MYLQGSAHLIRPVLKIVVGRISRQNRFETAETLFPNHYASSVCKVHLMALDATDFGSSSTSVPLIGISNSCFYIALLAMTPSIQLSQ